MQSYFAKTFVSGFSANSLRCVPRNMLLRAESRQGTPIYIIEILLYFFESSSFGLGSFFASITTWNTKSVTHF